MDRRIGRKLGERYSHVNGVLDTGLTIHKKKSLSNTEYIRRREEQFYRITRGQLGDLLEEYEAPDYESIRDTGNNGSPEGPKMASYRDDDEPVYNRPYLVLDVREAHEYQVNHICCAKSSPMTHLRRDLIPTDLNKFRNREVCDFNTKKQQLEVHCSPVLSVLTTFFTLQSSKCLRLIYTINFYLSTHFIAFVLLGKFGNL